jgi:serine/threonine protein kinase
MIKGTRIKTAFDEYEILGQIGCGGCGEVYKVKSSNNSVFAAKVLKEGLSAEKRKRFANEISFCQKDLHPGIVKVIDHGIVEDRPFYIMPFYEKNFRSIIDGSDQISKKLELFTSILDAVEAAHLAGCWHRDLKPENILIDKSNFAIITDFGIAHFEESDLAIPIETLSKERLANFQYAAPEQRHKGGTVDHRSDIFALGLMLNELFTKAVPQGTGFRKASTIDESLDYLDKIIDRMISNEPTGRYQSIEGIKIDLVREKQLKLTLQSYDDLTKKVIPNNELSHPLILSPVKIIKYDHNGSELIVQLNHDIPQEWQIAFLTRGAHTFSSWHYPKMVIFNRNQLTMRTPIIHSVEAVRYIKEWIINTNKVFPEYIKEIQTKKSEDNKRELMKKSILEKERLDFLEKVNKM